MLHLRICLRRAALRVLSSSPSSFSIKSRSNSTLAAPISRLNTQRTTFSPLQRRWASEEAATQQEPEADGAREAQHGRNKREQTFADTAADIKDLELATQSEKTTASSSLESATDSAKEHASATASQVSDAARSATETGETTASSSLETATDSVKERASAAASQVSNAAQSATETVTGAAQSLGAAAGFGSPRNPENPGGQRGNAAALDGEPSATVYVGNLYFDVRSEDLKKEFERAGPIDEAKVIMDHRGLSKGYFIPRSPVSRSKPLCEVLISFKTTTNIHPSDSATYDFKTSPPQPKPSNSTTSKTLKAAASQSNIPSTVASPPTAGPTKTATTPAFLPTALKTPPQRLSSSATCPST